VFGVGLCGAATPDSAFFEDAHPMAAARARASVSDAHFRFVSKINVLKILLVAKFHNV
jgi:hypothetical protein